MIDELNRNSGYALSLAEKVVLFSSTLRDAHAIFRYEIPKEKRELFFIGKLSKLDLKC